MCIFGGRLDPAPLRSFITNGPGPLAGLSPALRIQNMLSLSIQLGSLAVLVWAALRIWGLA